MSLIVLAVTAMASLPANAQDVLGASISGYTIDPAGTRMARAEVTAKSAESRLTSRALTDDSGFYALRGLPPGRYEVVATSGGTTSTSREIEVRTDISLRADFVVGISKLSEAVFVTAEPPLIEWSRATHVINVSGAVQRELPGSSLRGWSDFLLNVPGIVVTQTRLQTYALYGTAPGSGAVQVDGADATSVIQGSTLFSQFADDTFEDIAVVTGGKDMSAPLGLGALSRITTRAGSDMPHASVSVAAQPLTWNGANTPNGEDLTVETKQVDGSVGGPVARGKTWFFASVRVARNGTGVPRSLQQLQSLRLLSPEFRPFLNGYRGQGMFLKVTARGESRHALTASVANGSTRYGGAQPNEAGIFRDIVIGGPSAFARVTSTWGSRMLTTVSLDYNGKSQHTRNRSRETTGVNIHQSTFASGGRLIGTGALAVLEASPFAGTDFRMHMWTVSADALYFTSGRMGEHEISLGTQSQPRSRSPRHGIQQWRISTRRTRAPRARVIFQCRRVSSPSIRSLRCRQYVR
jgi:hypothetical protein